MKNIADQLKDLPYNSHQLNKIRDYLAKKAQEFNVEMPSVDTEVSVFFTDVCTCQECALLPPEHCSNTLLHPVQLYEAVCPLLHYFPNEELCQASHKIQHTQCMAARECLARLFIDQIIAYCTKADPLLGTEGTILTF